MRRSFLVPLIVTLWAVPAAAAELDPSAVSWTRLEFSGHKLIFKAVSEVRFDRWTASDARYGWIASPQGEVREPTGDEVVRLAIESTVAGRRDASESWLDPRAAGIFEHFKRQFGKKPYQKTYRFTNEGVYLRRLAPLDGEKQLEPGAWSKLEEFFYPYDDGGRCATILDESALFYVISAAPLDQPLELCVFTGKRVTLVEVAPDGEETLETECALPEQASKQVDALRLRLTPHALEGDDRSELEFLGLGGDVVVHVEKVRHIPVQVSGKVPYLGHVELKLSAVDLR